MKAAVLTLALGVLPATGCGARSTQRAITTIAVSIDRVDVVLAKQIEARATDCLQRDTYEDYQKCMQPLTRAALALEETAHVLRVAQDVVNAARRKDKHDLWVAYAPCVADSLSELVSALQAAGVAVPDQIVTALSLVQALGGECGPV